jgi:hypothetical protein
VLFAITIFSMIMVGAIMLMNQGSAAARRALDISLVRQQIDGQAETLRFLHDAYVASYAAKPLDPGTPGRKWMDLVKTPALVGSTGATKFGAVVDGKCPTPSSRQFIMNPAKATYVTSAFRQTDSYAYAANDASGTFKANGLWIEAVSSDYDANDVRFIDFHIRACWQSTGSTVPMTLGTIVRLYDKK